MPRGRPKGSIPGLAQRERQLLDLLYRVGPASAAELQAQMRPDLSNATIRTMLRELERKGHVVHTSDGARHVYSPTVSRRAAAGTAFTRIVDTFFAGSVGSAVATLLDERQNDMDDAELDALLRELETRRKRSKGKS